MKFFLGLILLGCASVQATIVQSSNLFPWSKGVTVGVFGGVPNRTTISATLTPGDTETQITAALTACPSGQVVYLPAGTYNINLTAGAFGTNSGRVIRGAGIDQTFVNVANVNGLNAFTTTLGSYSSFANNGLGNVDKGATNVTVTSASGMIVGGMIVFSQDYQTNLVWSPDGEGFDGPRFLLLRKVITAIVGQSVTFWPPLEWPLFSSLNPVERHETAIGARMCGIEDMTITGITNGARIAYRGTKDCWVKGVKFQNIGSRGVQYMNSMFGEVRECAFTGMTYPLATALGVTGSVDGNGQISHILVENNWFNGLRNPIMIEQFTGSVFGYNFTTNSGDTSANLTDGSFNSDHGAHCMFNLWEGNKGENWQADSSHGSSSHDLVFRNHFTGLHPTKTQFIRTMDPMRVQRWLNIVGNVLGNPTTVWAGYDVTGSPGAAATVYIYRLGYPNLGNNTIGTNSVYAPNNGGGTNDPLVLSTMLRHMNYDYFNLDIQKDPAIADETLVNSFYLPSKPSFFGWMPWPPISPHNPNMNVEIPAEWRFMNGADPGPELTATVGGDSRVGGNAVVK